MAAVKLRLSGLPAYILPPDVPVGATGLTLGDTSPSTRRCWLSGCKRADAREAVLGFISSGSMLDACRYAFLAFAKNTELETVVKLVMATLEVA